MENQSKNACDIDFGKNMNDSLTEVISRNGFEQVTTIIDKDRVLVWRVSTIWKCAKDKEIEVETIESFPLENPNIWFDFGEVPSVRNIVSHMRRVIDADLNHPVICGPNDEVLDGMHRIAKCLFLGLKVVNVVRLEELPEPEIVLSKSGEIIDSRI